MLCPRCDDQGNIQRVRINRTGEIVQLCDECDAMWFEDVVPSITTFQDFSTYMESLGLPGIWSELTIMPCPMQKRDPTRRPAQE